MTHTNPTQGFTFIHNRDPEDGNPYFKYLVCWHWITPNKGNRFFPSLNHPRPSSVEVMSLGQDFDGSVVGVIMDGPDKGCTVLLSSAMDAKGIYKAPTVH